MIVAAAPRYYHGQNNFQTWPMISILTGSLEDQASRPADSLSAGPTEFEEKYPRTVAPCYKATACNYEAHILNAWM